MSAPLDFLTASGEELYRWWASADEFSTNRAFAYLRDQTAAAAEAKVRGECARELAKEINRALRLEDQLADAKREGAWGACQLLHDDFFGDGWVQGRIKAFATKHYAPTPARSVTLGEWVVRYDATNGNQPWCVANGTEFWTHTIPQLLIAITYTPTLDEYTALCALAEAK